MARSITGGQFVNHARQKISEINQALQQLNEAKNQHKERRTALLASLTQALDEMAVLCLPSLNRAALDNALRHTGYGQFQANDPISAMEAERPNIAARIALIEAEPRFRRREDLLNPTTGDLVRKRDELTSQHQILEQEARRYEVPELIRLVERKYGTPEYPYRWWNFEYYQDWKWGDIFTDQFGKQSFSEVRQDFLRYTQDRDTLATALREVNTEIKWVEDLISEHQRLTYRLANLEQVTLQECRTRLREHLAHVDREQLFEWSKADQAKGAQVKRIHGLEKKLEYLDEMAERQFQAEQQALMGARAKLEQKIAKFQRPKHYSSWIPGDQADRMLATPVSKIYTRRDRFWRDYDTVVVFDRYDSFDYARDMLWWDLITDGRIDGNFIPEVHEWHSHHPHHDHHGHHGHHDDFSHAGSVLSHDQDASDHGGSVEAS